MGDHYGEDPIQDRLREVAGNVIDVETAIGTTNELLGKILGILENPVGEKGNPVSGDLITGDGEFILRLLSSMAHIYKCPPGYEAAWEKLRDLGLIHYHSSMVNGGFNLTGKGMLEIAKIFKAFPNGEIYHGSFN